MRPASTAILALLLFLFAMPCERAAASGLFGTREIFSDDLAAFSKWDGVVARADRQREDPAGVCRALAPGHACVAARWQSLIAELKTLPLRERVMRVNAELNRVPYVTAETNWHDPDHWETPLEFLARGGQCEDYAIAKFMALEQSGVPEAALRLAVVRDTWKSIDHAVAIVTVDGEALVLDNQSGDVVPASALRRYVPYYSINRTGWWYHEPARGRIEIARTGVAGLAP